MSFKFFDNTPMRKKSRQPPLLFGERYVPPKYSQPSIEWFNNHTLEAEVGNELSFDIESYKNYYCLGFKSIQTGRVLSIENREEKPFEFADLALWLTHNFCFVGFNTHEFDDILLWALIRLKLKPSQLKEMVNDIIVMEMSRYQVCKKWGFATRGYNSIDLLPVTPLTASLKMYAARIHAKRIQDLPYPAEHVLTPEEMDVVKYYNINDLDDNIDIYNKLSKQMKLRRTMSAEYNIDLRSKSDAQIAEAVIDKEVSEAKGTYIRKPKIEPFRSYFYDIPDYIHYENTSLRSMLNTLRNCEFKTDHNGRIKLPEEFTDLVIEIDNGSYKMGVGGLHSQEKAMSYKADEDSYIIDRDVASYYPALILNQGLTPIQMGDEFLPVYKSIVDRRLSAKRAKDKSTADSLKITINGTFGKTNSPFSKIYTPKGFIQVTITGQLCLLMYIDMMTHYGFKVISANTDGVVCIVPKDKYELFNRLVKLWENMTGLDTEETRYSAMYSQACNTYIAVKTNGKIKGKGQFSDPFADEEWEFAMKKNPQNPICSEAVKLFLTENKPIEETVKACKDVRKFVTVRKVAGGGYKDGFLVGKTVRWYYKKDEHGIIETGQGGKVSKSRGAWPLMELPDNYALPEDLDYTWYIQEAKQMLVDIGYYRLQNGDYNDFDLDDEIPF